MTLTLEILRPPVLEEFEVIRKKKFPDSVGEGTIGRDSGNAWILPHDTVSGKHALIRFGNGRFSIEDRRSTNGTFVNDERVQGSRDLSNGDNITIGPYTIAVLVDAPTIEPPRPVSVPAPVLPGTPVNSDVLDWETDLFKIPAPVVDDRRDDPDSLPPDVTPPVESEVVDVHVDEGENEAGRKSVQPGADVASPDDSMAAAILEGLGFDPAQVSPERARQLGRVLRVVVSGVRDLLEARQQLKRHFGMTGTIIEVAQNNPLKFSANADEALRKLLVERDDAYLDPLAAFEQAFNDLRNHQVAELEGMKAAYQSMLAKFDARTLQQRFDKQIEVSVLVPLPGPMAKLRYWDMYRQWLEEIGENPDSFRDLFGRDFVKAYEAFVQRYESRRDRRR